MSNNNTGSSSSSSYSKVVLLKDRPFLEYWDELWQLELRRKQGDFNGQGMEMILHFLQSIGHEGFLKHAQRTTSLLEIAKFYDN